jgi:GWxTD domain-containing protein
MTKAFIITFIVITINSYVSTAQNIKAFINHYEFYSSTDGPFIETHLAIEGSSLTWKSINSELSAEVELTLIFKLDSQIMAFTKEIIKSPKISDSSLTSQILMHSNRFLLKNGTYQLSIKLDDLQDTLESFYTTIPLKIEKQCDSIFISSIQVFNHYSPSTLSGIYDKGGYHFSPNLYGYFPVADSMLYFYAETYNTKKYFGENQAYLINYQLVENESGILLANYKHFKRMISEEVQVIMNGFNISKLPSGNYTLVIEVIDRNNQLKAKETYFFQRQNKAIQMQFDDIHSINIASTFVENITGLDTLKNIISSFAPISADHEKLFAKKIIEKGDPYTMQQYILSFWEQRSAVNPFEGFKNYMTKVQNVEIAYGNKVHRGYETDRGRVLLQYGEPKTILREDHDPAAYPYEIWHYYQTKNQSNIKFVFYNTDLTGSDFYLLHSNAIGEPNNYQWRLQLRKRDRGFHSIDDEGNVDDDWGSNLNRLYENPR